MNQSTITDKINVPYLDGGTERLWIIFDDRSLFQFAVKLYMKEVKSMTSSHDKPFLTWEQQLKKIEEKYGVYVDGSIDNAVSMLASLSYYDLINGNKHLISTLRPLKLSSLCEYTLHDRTFRGELVTLISMIETTFKNILAHIMAKYFGVEHTEYLDESKYKRSSDSNERKIFIDTLTKLYGMCSPNQEQYKVDQPLRDYIFDNTHTHIPPWILLKNASFSDATTLFKNLKTQHKIEIINYYSPSFSCTPANQNDEVFSFTQCLNICRKYRNLAAHNLNFIQYNKITLNEYSRRKLENIILSKRQIGKPHKSVLSAIGAAYLLLRPPLNQFLISLLEQFCSAPGLELLLRLYGLNDYNIDRFNNRIKEQDNVYENLIPQDNNV